MVKEEVSGYQTGSLRIHPWIENTYISLWSKSEIAAEDAKLSYVNTTTRIGVLCISLLHLSSIKPLDKLFLPCKEISLFLCILYASLLWVFTYFLHVCIADRASGRGTENTVASVCIWIRWWMYLVGVMVRKRSVLPLAPKYLWISPSHLELSFYPSLSFPFSPSSFSVWGSIV